MQLSGILCVSLSVHVGCCPLGGRVSPVYLLYAVFSHLGVAFCVVVVGKPAATVCRQGRGVYRFQNQVVRAVNQRCFGACVASPQNKHEVVALAVECADYGIGKLFPTVSLVACRLVGSDRQCCIEQQHSLACPAGQVA